MYDKDVVIKVTDMGKMYKLYNNPKDKILDALGLLFWKKNYYKEFWALRGINLTIHKGERIGFIGHNGAGKSTLLKCLTGNISPTSGNVTVNGKIQALLEMGTGFHPEFTGRENIRASLIYQGVSNQEIARLENEIIEFSELEEYIDQPVKTYSAGMYSRLAFSTASSVKPELMIIDEILGAGDAYFNGKCVERMRNLTAQDGATFLFVSHDLQSVQALCTRLIWIDHGTIKYDGEVLYGIKQYLNSVRKIEEQRIKIKEIKHDQAQGAIVDRREDLFHRMRFRLMSTSETSQSVCRIYTLRLFHKDELLNELIVGASMDNDLNANEFIVDVPGNTAWGKAVAEKQQYYREFVPILGIDRHAPFEFYVSKEFNLEDITLEILADLLANSEVELQYYNQEQEKYHTCGFLQGRSHSHRIELSQELVEKKKSENKDLDNFATTEASLKNVILVDKAGVKGRVFPFGQGPRSVEVDVCFVVPRNRFYFNFLLFSAKGEKVLSAIQQVELAQDVTELTLEYCLPELKLGEGEYNISLALYDQLDVTDDSREQPFLAMIDRGVFFKVEKPLGYAFATGYFIGKEDIKVKKGSTDIIRVKALL